MQCCVFHFWSLWVLLGCAMGQLITSKIELQPRTIPLDLIKRHTRNLQLVHRNGGNFNATLITVFALVQGDTGQRFAKIVSQR